MTMKKEFITKTDKQKTHKNIQYRQKWLVHHQNLTLILFFLKMRRHTVYICIDICSSPEALYKTIRTLLSLYYVTTKSQYAQKGMILWLLMWVLNSTKKTNSFRKCSHFAYQFLSPLSPVVFQMFCRTREWRCGMLQGYDLILHIFNNLSDRGSILTKYMSEIDIFWCKYIICN